MKKSYQSTPIFTLVLSILSILLSANQASATKIRVVSYNVACGQWATPERIAKELTVLRPDIVLLSEVPKANRGKKVKDWSQRLADKLGLDHVHVGTVSSAGHKSPNWGDPTGNYGGKFKSILSRTPLPEVRTSRWKEVVGNGPVPYGWKQKSMGGSSLCIPCTCLDLHIINANQLNFLPGRVPSIKPWQII